MINCIKEKSTSTSYTNSWPFYCRIISLCNCGAGSSRRSLVIKSLVNHYTQHNISNMGGPITDISGKKLQLQLVECSNDMDSMTDATKFVGFVLLLIDGCYSFETETFELLNILQVHRFPKVISAITYFYSNDVKNKGLHEIIKLFMHQYILGWSLIWQGCFLHRDNDYMVQLSKPNNEDEEAEQKKREEFQCGWNPYKNISKYKVLGWKKLDHSFIQLFKGKPIEWSILHFVC